MIKVEHLYKNYSDEIKVLKDISFTFEDGKTYAIIGSSGGGKSTFIRCLNMLEEPTSGTITLDDEVVNSPSTDLTKIREKMGMVFQNFNLFSHMDVKKNVAYALMKVKGMDETSAYKKAIELLGNVGLSHRVDSYPHQLSGGEKQRVAIARALAMEPEVLLCDEPTSALDPEMTTEVLKVLKGLSHTGLTMIVVTHEMNFAKEVADYILYMDKGQIVECTTPEEFFTNAKTERARQFISNML
ncbi:amino acid ABC transporter ATP-binding protein [Amedibacterium intestinale]|uniref:amino acid ABC transporter ATP-binding protein n=1 Tax=Amedibacterium intestinale TaxID=2583452 RepID=UPI000E505B49|nr:amino acid ABC transporter ATP-binding protein [Amedibacterium intestinale]RHO20629.1 amino acid ABC transporter ATP-binding protein [Eubacterium sp. AM18-26]RHO24189.1 amino acid ABC transporter ATP-binding protein [Eubacterium sp. AM18-10LB-B]BBK62748.1 arginine ABC transporter ATP-binding protein [Amedibacterium intestinale]